MEKDKHITRVVFRKFGKGDIVALFPDEPGTNSPHTCSSYQHIGQHGSAEPRMVVAVTRRAVADEFAPLLRELEGLGYNLKVLWTVPATAYENRRKALTATASKLA